jgi:hypothetical protein
VADAPQAPGSQYHPAHAPALRQSWLTEPRTGLLDLSRI